MASPYSGRISFITEILRTVNTETSRKPQINLSSFLNVDSGFAVIEPMFASRNNQYRALIRTHLVASLKSKMSMTDEEEVILLDLNQRPKLPGVQISISHSKNYGGYICLKSASAVGFDLESPQRISELLLKRVAHPDDCCTEHPAVWSIKEACFKALANSERPEVANLKLLSQIQISNFESDHFKASYNGFNLTGTFLSQPDLLAAVAVIEI